MTEITIFLDNVPVKMELLNSHLNVEPLLDIIKILKLLTLFKDVNFDLIWFAFDYLKQLITNFVLVK